MIVQVLGCSGSIAAGCRTTSFLLDDDVLIDAGTGVGDMPLDALARVDHILLSHSHLDHILSIGLLADSVMRERNAASAGRSRSTRCPRRWRRCAPTCSTASSGPTSRACRAPSGRCSRWCRSRSATCSSSAASGSRCSTPSHTVPAVGFAIDAGSAGWWVYTGDTGPNPALWARLREHAVAHLVIETAFRDDERQLARISRHLCPAALGHELQQLGGSVDVHITHIKPGERAAVMAEIGQLGSPHKIRALEIGDVMRLEKGVELARH